MTATQSVVSGVTRAVTRDATATWQTTSSTAPAMTLGLAGSEDFGNASQFINRCKNGFQWDQSVTINDAGYITAISTDTAMRCITVIYDQAQDGLDESGDFVLKWTGTATLNPEAQGEGTITNRVDSTNRVEFTFNQNTLTTGQSSALYVEVEASGFTDLTEVILCAADEESILDGGQEWRPHYVELTKQFRGLRGMEILKINNSVVSTYAGMRQTGDMSYAEDDTPRRGIPLETFVDLCNLGNCDLYMNTPHLMDDDEVTLVMEYVKNNLNSNLYSYWAYSNEIWNNTFDDQEEYSFEAGLTVFHFGSEFPSPTAGGSSWAVDDTFTWATDGTGVVTEVSSGAITRFRITAAPTSSDDATLYSLTATGGSTGTSATVTTDYVGTKQDSNANNDIRDTFHGWKSAKMGNLLSDEMGSDFGVRHFMVHEIHTGGYGKFTGDNLTGMGYYTNGLTYIHMVAVALYISSIRISDTNSAWYQALLTESATRHTNDSVTYPDSRSWFRTELAADMLDHSRQIAYYTAADPSNNIDGIPLRANDGPAEGRIAQIQAIKAVTDDPAGDGSVAAWQIIMYEMGEHNQTSDTATGGQDIIDAMNEFPWSQEKSDAL